MTDNTKEDLDEIKEKGYFLKCKKCSFIVPFSEYKLFKECGQCGSKEIIKVKSE